MCNILMLIIFIIKCMTFDNSIYITPFIQYIEVYFIYSPLITRLLICLFSFTNEKIHSEVSFLMY